MPEIKIISSPIPLSELKTIAENQFKYMVKAVVNIESGEMSIGGELHSDEEKVMIENGSPQENLWGINIYPEQTGEDRVEFDSMINLRPYAGNNTRGVENIEIQKRIIEIINKLIID
jgi:hypothetical protein